MVHDAARPFASAELLRRLMESTTPTVGAIPVMPVTEALKRVNSEGGIQVADREEFYVTQTPQSFFREALVQALEKPCTVRAFKDEAEAWLAAGLELRCIEGERLNFKVTWPEDLKLAEALIINREKITDEKERGGDGVRVGIGYDVHRLVPERPLVLGGVEIPSPLGLLGHSDADVLAHAVADAILGAADLPDIGNLFPASDNRYKNADSMKLLREAVELVNGELWKIVWVDAVLEAQIPRLNFFLPAMKEKLSAVLNPQGPHCVNIKAKSAEGTNDEGAGRSIVCRAVATLRYACEGVAK
jgi:2-C-methyl-D-erythritol 4-phosphate cytidylyltransferase/2-C-methyl-D-erythritol 2,4-cyclodiphosphate synthase